MKMEPLSSGDLRIWMNNEELCRWGLHIADMKAGDPATDRALRRLLGLAKQRFLFYPSGTVTVEALPFDGGCLFLFSGHHRAAAVMLPQVYTLESADALLSFAKTLSAEDVGRLPYASLYREGERYVLIVYAGLGAPNNIRRLLGEFGTPAGEGYATASYVEEHLQAVTVGDALHRLCRAYECPVPERRRPAR